MFDKSGHCSDLTGLLGISFIFKHCKISTPLPNYFCVKPCLQMMLPAQSGGASIQNILISVLHSGKKWGKHHFVNGWIQTDKL